MGLSWQQGPLSPGAFGRFLVPDPLPKRLLYVELLRRRMRVRFGGTWIADSEQVLHELGLVRRDDEDQSAPTPRLLGLFEDAYFKHYARRKRSTEGSFDRDSIIRDNGRP